MSINWAKEAGKQRHAIKSMNEMVMTSMRRAAGSSKTRNSFSNARKRAELDPQKAAMDRVQAAAWKKSTSGKMVGVGTGNNPNSHGNRGKGVSGGATYAKSAFGNSVNKYGFDVAQTRRAAAVALLASRKLAKAKANAPKGGWLKKKLGL